MWAWPHVICCRSFFISLPDNASSDEMRNTCLYTRPYSSRHWNYVLGHMNMIVDLWYIILSNEWTNNYKWMNTEQSFFPIPALLHHEQVIHRERLVQCHAILLSPHCGDTTPCIRHLVSDMLLSLIPKENVHNVIPV